MYSWSVEEIEWVSYQHLQLQQYEVISQRVSQLKERGLAFFQHDMEDVILWLKKECNKEEAEVEDQASSSSVEMLASSNSKCGDNNVLDLSFLPLCDSLGEMDVRTELKRKELRRNELK
jgi:hypothetical protein